MTKLILGLFMGAGLAFSILAIVEEEERKKAEAWERWRNKLP